MGAIADRVAKMRGCSLAQIVAEIERMEMITRAVTFLPATEPMAFDKFWDAFPNKVGKADARKAFVKASKKVAFGFMMEGLAAYVGKQDDRPWCNPATWLNQERWADQPATVSTQPRSKTSELRNDLRNRIEAGQGNFGAGPVRQLAHRQPER